MLAWDGHEWTRHDPLSTTGGQFDSRWTELLVSPREPFIDLSGPRFVVLFQSERIFFRLKRGSVGLRQPFVGIKGLCAGLRGPSLGLR